MAEEKKTTPAKKAPAKAAAPKKAAPKKTEAKKAAPKKTAAKKTAGKTVTVQQIGSGIGRPADQRGTLVGLGLNKMNRVRTLEDTPAVRGMIKKISHLVKIIDEAA